MSKKIRVILTFVLLGIAAFAGWQIYLQQSEYQSGEKAYAELGQYVHHTDASVETSLTQLNPSESETRDDPKPADNINWPEVDFVALQAINPDIIAWIYIEGIDINYPVVQGEDNSYYLKHMADGSYNGSGAIFMDFRNESDFLDSHTIIYGHHMKNGTMFSGLDKYKKQEFYDKHPVALILTPDKKYQLEFFAGYVADVEADAWQLDFTMESKEDWIAAARSKSCFESSIIPAVTDKIVTLSTCSYEFSNARFVLLGVLK